MTDNQAWFSEETFITLFKLGWVVDGRAGGLVVGRSHDAGNIYMLKEMEDGKYIIPGSLEGGEYILNHYAHLSHAKRIEEINGEEHQELGEQIGILVSGNTRLINTSAMPHDKLLLIDSRGQYIVNKHSTAKHLPEIEFINSCDNAYSVCDLFSLEKKAASEDGS